MKMMIKMAGSGRGIFPFLVVFRHAGSLGEGRVPVDPSGKGGLVGCHGQMRFPRIQIFPMIDQLL